MSKPEDKTLNSLRIISEKRASKNHGSIVTQGGLHVGENINCEKDIVTNELVVKGLTKLAGDVSIGGTIYCPGLYNFDSDVFRFKRNVVPECGLNTLGTCNEPWGIIFSKCIKTENTETVNLCAGINSSGIPSLLVGSGQINISDELNIINPITNVIMLKSCSNGSNGSNGSIEAYCPIYNQWNSCRAIELPYHPNEILHINTSTILLNICNEVCLELFYNTDLVPDSTKVKIYFIKQNQLCAAQYRLVLIRFDKKYIFTSVAPIKNIKLFFLGHTVYLLN